MRIHNDNEINNVLPKTTYSTGNNKWPNFEPKTEVRLIFRFHLGLNLGHLLLPLID